jgi:hypothetical protein
VRVSAAKAGAPAAAVAISVANNTERRDNMLKSSVFCGVAVLSSVLFKARHNLPAVNQISVIGVISVQRSD